MRNRDLKKLAVDKNVSKRTIEKFTMHKSAGSFDLIFYLS